ncbi:hypothetical protein BaRGS_00018254 [Batillaria attramentaria]|uniref:G-protein coupled receptors family 1 profile domain-containing protein n=1 Tax=Batillaria attramentaria TaxID=370345 RepID=A0ABD0KTY2_9CAEN
MAASNQRDETAVYSILLIILLLGLLGNVLSFIVWIKAATHRGSSSSGSHGNARLFAVLSLSDALSIVSFVVAYALKLGADSTSTCDSHVFIFIAAVFTFYSDYITIVIGLQRLVAVLRPFSLGRVCSAGRQWAAVGGVFILNLLLRALFGMWTIETHNFCSDSDTWLFTNVTELSQFSKDVAFVYMGIELFPLALLLSVNGILLRFLWSARQVGTL